MPAPISDRTYCVRPRRVAPRGGYGWRRPHRGARAQQQVSDSVTAMSARMLQDRGVAAALGLSDVCAVLQEDLQYVRVAGDGRAYGTQLVCTGMSHATARSRLLRAAAPRTNGGKMIVRPVDLGRRATTWPRLRAGRDAPRAWHRQRAAPPGASRTPQACPSSTPGALADAPPPPDSPFTSPPTSPEHVGTSWAACVGRMRSAHGPQPADVAVPLSTRTPVALLAAAPPRVLAQSPLAPLGAGWGAPPLGRAAGGGGGGISSTRPGAAQADGGRLLTRAVTAAAQLRADLRLTIISTVDCRERLGGHSRIRVLAADHQTFAHPSPLLNLSILWLFCRPSRLRALQISSIDRSRNGLQLGRRACHCLQHPRPGAALRREANT